MGRFCELRVVNWAAILVSDIDGSQQSFGHAAAEDAIPPAVRRRMGKLERLAARCAFGVLDDKPTGELVFCSRYGNVETLASLLRDIANGQLTSPMAFSCSVHNATPSFVGQIRKERIGHTALAAGPNTFAAGLIESYARLVADDCQDVTLVFADAALPEPYDEFEEEKGAPGLAMAVRLEHTEDATESLLAVCPGRRGALAVLDGLRNNETVCLGLGERATCPIA
jgi:hypothetical protein